MDNIKFSNINKNLYKRKRNYIESLKGLLVNFPEYNKKLNIFKPKLKEYENKEYVDNILSYKKEEFF